MKQLKAIKDIRTERERCIAGIYTVTSDDTRSIKKGAMYRYKPGGEPVSSLQTMKDDIYDILKDHMLPKGAPGVIFEHVKDSLDLLVTENIRRDVECNFGVTDRGGVGKKHYSVSMYLFDPGTSKEDHGRIIGQIRFHNFTV